MSGKFLPQRTPETAAWWDACMRHELLLQRCTACATVQFYPRTSCSSCLGSDLEWIKSAGLGKVLTYTIVRRPVAAAYADDVPYTLAIIELDEGPQMMSIVRGCDPEHVKIGLRVEAGFEQWSDEVTMPVFKASVSQ